MEGRLNIFCIYYQNFFLLSLQSLVKKKERTKDKVTNQVENYGPVSAGKHRKSLERGTSIPIRKFSDFSRPVPAGKHKIPVRILLPLPAISGAFLQDPAGSGDFPASFLQDSAGSSGRNLRLGNNIKK
jgi:hypothetical protein